MVRPVTSKYGFWLAGYYDDFMGARAIPDDSNSPSIENTYDSKTAHHGNILNGEANLNPRFRWSIVDRERIGSVLISTALNRYLKNRGSYEFVGNDTIRQNHSKYEGTAQLQYPDGHTNANRIKFANGTDTGISGTNINGYQLFCNGYDTTNKYLVPTGTTDASYGRTDMEAYYTSAVTFSNTKYANKIAGTFANGAVRSTTRQTSFANLAGVWEGEAFAFTASDTPTNLFHPVKSPSGKPFLVIQTTSSAPSSNPTIAYDGTLNSKLDGDIFTVRLCVRSFSGHSVTAGKEPQIVFNIGYAATNLTSSLGFTTTPAISYTWRPASHPAGTRAYTYDYFGASFIGTGSNTNIVNDDCWLDFDFVMDYTNRKYNVYCDGELIGDTESMNGTPTAESVYGWSMSLDATYTKSSQYLMLDRVGLVRPLTDHVKDTEKLTGSPVTDLSMNLPNNGFSNCKITIFDDANDTDNDNVYGELDADYAHNKLTTLFNTDSISNWELLIFADVEVNRIDRPIWRGIVKNFEIDESIRSGRKLAISAEDRTSLLDKQIPVWDIGQASLSTTYGSETPYWLSETEGYKHLMNFGSEPLKLTQNSIGFNSNKYLEEAQQRTQLYSGIPIQMYNNEEVDFGPNEAHKGWEGINIVGFGKTVRGTYLGDGNSDVKSFVAISAPNSTTEYVQNSTTQKIKNTTNPNYNNNTITLQNKVDVPSSNRVRYNEDTDTKQILWYNGLTYEPETAKIILITNYSGAIFHTSAGTTYQQWISFNVWQPHVNNLKTEHTSFYMDADPDLNLGDYIYVNHMHDNYSDKTTSKMLHPSVRGKQKVVNVKKIHNYFVASNAFTFQTNFLWVVTTDRPYTENGKGDYVNSTLLSGNSRFSWSKDVQGTITPASTNHALTKYRNLHTQWMTDLPKSLWFQYRYGQIRETAFGSCVLQASVAVNDNKVKITQDLYNTLNAASAKKRSGCAEIVTSGTSQVYSYVKFIYKYLIVDGSNYYLGGTSDFLNVPITIGGGKTATVNICDISDDYKHLWLLWADMRNNGQANADGGHRKTSFGLTSPVYKNYNPTLYYSDQFDIEGNVDKFTDLKIGKDIIIEEVNPVSDYSTTIPMSKPIDYQNPISASSLSENSTGDTKLKVTKTSHGLNLNDYVYLFNTDRHDGYYQIKSKDTNTFTFKAGTFIAGATDDGQAGGIKYAITTGSDKEIDIKYHDWENKAGAFIVIDSSPFFNLNTYINGGRVGQVAGGNTNLVDYETSVKGFPALLDNYYSEAIAKDSNSGDEFSQHKNQNRIISESTTLSNSIQIGDVGIIVEDLSIFGNSGMGRIIAREKDDGSTVSSDKDFYFTWSSKKNLSTAQDGVSTTPANGALVDVVKQNGTTDSSGNADNVGIMTGTVIPVGMSEILSADIGQDTNGTSLDATLLDFNIQAGMLIYRKNNAGTVLSKEKVVLVKEYTVGGATYQNRMLVTGLWTAGLGGSNNDRWEIPPQLGGIITVVNSLDDPLDSATGSSHGLENSIHRYIDNNALPLGSTEDVALTTTDEKDKYSFITVSSTVSNQYALRILMHLEGTTKSLGGNTYYDHDKFRALWLASLISNWRAPIKLPLMYDINNIPITYNMSSDGTVNNTDDYGSMFNANSKNLLDVTKGITKLSGFGNINNYHTTFSWLAGRDGRLSYRPKYNSGVNFDRLNAQRSKFSSNVKGKISNVRLFYDKSKSFVDFPATNLNDSTNWKIIQHPEITTSDEALKMAQQEYNTNKSSKITINITPRQDSYEEDSVIVNVVDKMVHTGRYGYIADPYIAFHGNDDLGNASDLMYWTRLGTGGALFTGAQSGLDGNMGNIPADIYNRYGQTKYSQANTSATDIGWENNFYWYGAKSLSYAVQIVDVTNRCPLVSEKTGQEMRMFVAIKPNQTGVSIDDLIFTVYMVDYAYSTNKNRTTLDLASSTTYTTGTASDHIGSIDVKGNGFYEMPIPKSYWSKDGGTSISGGKIIISVNTEYCRALLRHRCGDPTNAIIVQNSNSLQNINISADGSGGNYNASSIFPLGGKIFTEWDMFSAPRNEYYAPRIHICKDIKYQPATYVTYTDKSLDLNQKVMSIEKIDWKVSQRGEDLNLILTSDESTSSDIVLANLFSKANNPVFQPPPPAPTQTISIENDTSDDAIEPDNNVGGQDNDDGVGSPAPPNLKPPVLEPVGSFGFNVNQENNINSMSSTTYGNMTNRIGLGDDNNSFSEFSILGQTRPSTIPSSIRGIDAQVEFNPTGGTAIKTSNGISFPGVGVIEGEGLADTPVNITTASLKIKIPNDVKTNEVNINTQITHAANQASSNVAELIVTVTCDQTSNSKSKNTLVYSNYVNNNLSLFSNKILGANVGGNTLTVEIKRVAGSTNDSSDYNSVILQDTQVRLNRVAGHSSADTNNFTTYS